jgi:Trk K+ transport system NAD-binding subunit
MILNDRIIVAELKTAEIYIGHTLEAINPENRFGIRPVAVKIAPAEKGLTALFNRDFQVDLSCDPHRPLEEKDRLVVIGRLDDIKRFVE